MGRRRVYHPLDRNVGIRVFVDEFYGIPPRDTWDAFLMIGQARQTKSLEIPLDKGPQIVEAKTGRAVEARQALYGGGAV